MKRQLLVVFFALALFGCASQQPGGDSPSGHSPSEDLGGKARLTSLLVSKYEESGEDLDPTDGIPEADKPRALRCVMDAMTADMSEAQANRVADMLERRITIEEDFVRYWIVPNNADHAERMQQVRARIYQICPDLAPAIGA